MAQAKYMPGSDDITVGDDALGALVTALYDIANQARRAASGDPVEPAGVRVLVWVQALGTPRPSELATKLRLDLSTVSRHVRALRAEGYLAVAPDAKDGRAQRITLTDRGRDAIKTVVANRRAALGAVFSHWPAEEQAQLTTLMRRLADEMAQQDEAVVA